MNTKILEYMLAIAETRSITRAAEQFYLSHPALSRHLKNVESELGTPLFTRRPDGMVLTPAGIIFMNDAQAILHIESKLNQDLSAMRHRQRKQLHVMVDHHLHNQFVRSILPLFRAAHPDYTVASTACNASQARRALLDGQADLALFDTMTTRATGLEFLPFSEHALLLAFPKNFTGPRDIQGLRQAVEAGMFVCLYPVGTTARTLMEQQLAAHQIYPAKVLEGFAHNSIDHIRQGNSCSILLDLFCTAEVRAHVCVGEPFCTIYGVVAYASGATLPVAAQDLMRIVVQNFS